MSPAAAPGCAPESAVDRVGAGFGRHRQAAGLEKGDCLVSLDAGVPNGCDDLEIGGKDPKRDVETHLIVAGAGGAVRDCFGSDLSSYLHHRQRLLGSLGRDAEWIDLAAEDVSLDEKAHEALEDLLAGVYLMVLDGADSLRLLPDRTPLLGGGPAGIDVDRVDGPPVIGEAGDAVGGIQPAGEGEREGAAARMHIA